MKASFLQTRVHFPAFIFFVFFAVLNAGSTVKPEATQVGTDSNPATNDSSRIEGFTVPNMKNAKETHSPRLQIYQGFESIQGQACSCSEELRAIHEHWKYESSQRTVMKGALELFATDLINLKALVKSKLTNDNASDKGIKTIAASPGVAFSARVSEHLTDLQPQQIIVFDQLITNVGSAYDPSSGVFTCPLSGTYQLFATILSGFNTKVESGVVVNDIEVARLYSGAQQAHGSSTAAVILLLEKGDLVSVRVLYQPTSHVHGVYSTFSGYLLQTL